MLQPRQSGAIVNGPTNKRPPAADQLAETDDTADIQLEFAESLAGVPDEFSRLWTPHRMAYINGENKPESDHCGDCPFCLVPKKTDEDGLIIKRGKTCFVLMNLYPYSSGHMLVCPYRHVSWYWQLTDEETIEIAQLTKQAMQTAQKVMQPAGFNLGINQGSVAGAGIAAHLHQHVVPRWKGDANFMPIVARTKPIPQLLADGRDSLARSWVDKIDSQLQSGENHA